ncbi:MAG: hypothetical protein RLZZ273_713 [Bacteroidota bacterium]|jgi:uncharacterized protein YodC (DUF2158 family)
MNHQANNSTTVGFAVGDVVYDTHDTPMSVSRIQKDVGTKVLYIKCIWRDDSSVRHEGLFRKSQLTKSQNQWQMSIECNFRH